MYYAAWIQTPQGRQTTWSYKSQLEKTGTFVGGSFETWVWNRVGYPPRPWNFVPLLLHRCLLDGLYRVLNFEGCTRGPMCQAPSVTSCAGRIRASAAPGYGCGCHTARCADHAAPGRRRARMPTMRKRLRRRMKMCLGSGPPATDQTAAGIGIERCT